MTARVSASISMFVKRTVERASCARYRIQHDRMSISATRSTCLRFAGKVHVFRFVGGAVPAQNCICGQTSSSTQSKVSRTRQVIAVDMRG